MKTIKELEDEIEKLRKEKEELRGRLQIYIAADMNRKQEDKYNGVQNL